MLLARSPNCLGPYERRRLSRPVPSHVYLGLAPDGVRDLLAVGVNDVSERLNE